MTDNVRSLSAIATVNYPEQIARGLEQIAAAIRGGAMAVSPMKAVLVLSGRDGQDFDLVAHHFFGADSGAAEIVGMLELAKHEAINAS